MTPMDHYKIAEEYSAKSEGAGGSAPEAGLKYAVLAVAHALLAHPPSPAPSPSSSPEPLLPRNLKPVR